MTFIPAAVAALAVIIVWFYPLTTEEVERIAASLKQSRAEASAATQEAEDIAENFDNINN